ncbi:unnamed protein product [Callosobruchus maculatus]|uniref:DUF7869 domain-containing protein n=1 Tax=Callosobruchus maculatus TaxID=64391 RepID=A0A653BXV3_CALMS|nr:unnamed protein product [Callosobruchus maculatus]
MDDCGSQIKKTPPNLSRKKLKLVEKHKREVRKRLLYSPKQLPQKPTCKHVKIKAFKCNELTMADLMKIHQHFYSKKDKLSQDTYIFKWCNSRDPKRHRNITQTTKSVSIEYRVPTLHGKHVRICRDAFCGILGVKKDRLQGVMKRYLKGKIPEEGRGGDRVKGKNDAKKEAMSEYIESLKSVESHYCRSAVSTRTYLPCDLNIKRLAKMYNDSVEEHLQAKESFFRFYFNTNYNIGFGTPKTDVCSTCIRFKEELKEEKDVGKHNDLIIKQRVHTLKAKAFFQFLKESRQTRETFSIDCQKNLCLPKLPDQSAYFSQQYNLYNFTVVNGSSKDKLGKDHVWSYVWTDLDLAKNSSVISSALFDALSKFEFSGAIEEVSIFADGCPAQNKNITMIGMLCYWLKEKAPVNIKKIQVIFPVVGHSYMPPDRVFGLIESKIKKTPSITDPSEYCSIIEEFATVRKLTEDWVAQDWKTSISKVVKNPGSWHFKFNPAKRFIITKLPTNNVLVRGEVNYKSDLRMDKSVLKRGQKISFLGLNTMNPGRVSDKKKADSVANLLQLHFGADWRDDRRLDFYKRAIESATMENDVLDNDSHQEECCSRLETEDDLRV